MSSSLSSRPIEHRLAEVGHVDFGERVIDLIAIPYNTETTVYGPDGRSFVERCDPGAFDDIEQRGDHVTVNRDHLHERVIGRAIAYQPKDERGLVASLRISDTPLGQETLRLAADDVLKASVGMRVLRFVRAGGVRRIKGAVLDHIALVPNPAYSGAGVLAVRTNLAPPPLIEVRTPNLDAVLKRLGDDFHI